MQPNNPNVIRTIRHMTSGGPVYIPTDTGQGHVYRPFAKGSRGERIGTLETLYDYYIDNVPDPDEALRQDPNFLETLHQHPFVSADMEKRRISVSSMPWRIDPNPDGKDKAAAEFIASFVTETWRRVPGITRLYDEMMNAVLAGGIGHEWIWADRMTFEVPIKFNMVDKSRVLFDRQGNMALLTREQPVYGTYVMPTSDTARGLRKQFPTGKFQYHVHNRRPGRWSKPALEGYMYFGVGEDIALYIPITFDSFVLRFRMKWMEKYGLPPTVIYHPNNVGIDDEVLRVADSVRGESVITVPRTANGPADGMWKIEQLNVPTMTNDAFSNFSQMWTRPICKDILLGGDAGQYGAASQTSGYSSMVSQQDSGPNAYYRSDARKIDATLNDPNGIIQAIARSRFPNLPDSYIPIHRLEPKEERDRNQEMQIATATMMMVPLAIDEVYERSGFRKPKPGEQTIGGAQQPPGGQPGAPGAPGQPPGAPDPSAAGQAGNGTPKAPMGHSGDIGGTKMSGQNALPPSPAG